MIIKILDERMDVTKDHVEEGEKEENVSVHFHEVGFPLTFVLEVKLKKNKINESDKIK